MKIATKAMVTMLVITMLALSSTTASALGPEGSFARRDRKLERLHQHHDRKFELRASVLGLTPAELRDELKHKTFSQIVKEKGFASREVFHIAMEGKLREELKKRGWTNEKISRILEKRQHRFERNLQN